MGTSKKNDYRSWTAEGAEKKGEDAEDFTQK